MALIEYINIDCDSNYFDTKEQIKLRNIHWFMDASDARQLSGSNQVFGLFSRERISKDKQIYNSPVYPTSSIVLDASGTDRNILSPNIDYYTSSSLDAFRNGVDITQEKHWTAGLVKITAGSPGHLYNFDY